MVKILKVKPVDFLHRPEVGHLVVVVGTTMRYARVLSEKSDETFEAREVPNLPKIQNSTTPQVVEVKE